MTEARLYELVEEWRERLIPEWSVKEISVGLPDDVEDTGQYASIFTTDEYNVFRIAFADDILERSPWDTEHTIVHEIVHCLLRDFDKAARRPLSDLGSSAASLAHRTIEHELEQLTDRLATTLMQTAGKGRWPLKGDIVQ